ncbi:DUF2793 domain-containing protein [Histidinibacterium aquaticum]|uniref:DUF2793 domain-containing protein n=1 Tax=Histidinibacterium aquaticum TaxID=2613962 RepID=A0A5J5GGD3_9RHOB|nr:DUF2793 domain-containing protein [Histidinibacterium aquaticum]KAA9006793.1 DUF2793 domain-containing protein [Histidinibacterium aquaticum]
MSDRSARLDLPFLLPSQAQKHVTVNDAFETLDTLVQLTVEAIGSTTPPSDPEPGEVHTLGDGATGDWAGHDGDLAAWTGTGWVFRTPRPGWRAWDLATSELRIWSGTGWVLPDGRTQNLAHLGVNATADATNRLSVAAPASLFSHEGAGHRIKVNKASEAETASLLFQSAWSGRAEIGLAGDDTLSVKVSADGASWTTAITIDPESGALRPAVHAAAALPNAALVGEGAFIHVTGEGPAWSDGTGWRRLSDGQPVGTAV